MTTARSTTLNVEGMSCNSCVKHVNLALRALPGVQGVEVDLKAGLVSVTHDPLLPSGPMISALDAAGYPARENNK